MNIQYHPLGPHETACLPSHCQCCLQFLNEVDVTFGYDVMHDVYSVAIALRLELMEVAQAKMMLSVEKQCSSGDEASSAQ
jgi:hypothetical protein